MIEKLEMHLPNYEVQISNTNSFINGRKIIINDEDIRNIIRIIRLWKNLYKDVNGLDKEKYYIYIKTDKEETFINFISNFPADFSHLTAFLGDLYVRKQV